MGKSIGGRITLIAVLTAASIILVLPSLTDSLPVAQEHPSLKIHLGLDLQGGVFLRLAVEIDKAIENTTLRYADDARAILREKGIPVLAMAKNGIDGFSLTLPPGDFADRAMKGLKEGGGMGDYTPGAGASAGGLVGGGAGVEGALKGTLREEDQLLYLKNVDPQTGRATKTPIVVSKRAVLTGDTIKTARDNFESPQGGAYVSLSFDNRGARTLDRVTGESGQGRG